jgi:hypothetical protein
MRRRILVLKIGLMLFCLFWQPAWCDPGPQCRGIPGNRPEQYEAKVDLPAARGIISDRNGKVLVSNAMMISFGADPKIAGMNVTTSPRQWPGDFTGREKST